MIEEWKQSVMDSYEVSSLGNVRSIDRMVYRKRNGKEQSYFKKGVQIKGQKEGSGYLQFSVGRKHVKIHRLVAMSFLDNPLNKRCINHKNGIKTDNRVENLEWATHSENIIHAFKNGLNTPQQTGKSGSLHHLSKAVLSINQFAIIEHGSTRECARYFGCDEGTIYYHLKRGGEFKGASFHRI